MWVHAGACGCMRMYAGVCGCMWVHVGVHLFFHFQKTRWIQVSPSYTVQCYMKVCVLGLSEALGLTVAVSRNRNLGKTTTHKHRCHLQGISIYVHVQE